MFKKQDWHMHLTTYIENQANRKYHIGKHDCFTFAFGCVRVQTGKSLLKAEYDTYIEASRILSLAGGVKEFLTARLGLPVPLTYATYGDVVSIRKGVVRAYTEAGDIVEFETTSKNIRTIGIVDMSCRFALVKSEKNSLVRVSLHDCEYLWDVECIE